MEHIPDSNDSPAEFSGGSFTPPGTPPPLSAGSFTPPGTPPPLSPSHPLFVRNQQMIEDSDVDGESMEEDPEEESRRQIRDMIQNFDDSDEPYLLFQVDGERVLAPGETSEGAINPDRIQAALQNLAPEDEETVVAFFNKMKDAYLELVNNPQRDRFNAEEDSYYLHDLPKIGLILRAIDGSDAQLLADLLLSWMTLIQNVASARRRRRVQELLDCMTNPTPSQLSSLGADSLTGVSLSECSICLDDFFDNKRIVVQAPCHPTHAFHRICLQDWLEGRLDCPMCRAQFILHHSS
ncbi:uncharacterized protein PGTG_18003 [Puccinia graminis f. sp. tritici CRL 75-36-700-3]|uniref:RING-type domain-containing protein n=1 Tax=Puccinia graminis f. sp. tritici (strain CRL 75-36-700-3 / race SCCL) TaxID=418459 RepID=E3L704_PUCGT|nr:uncharacterized protein PGTG_18003 [Puccinia graminis f. sp. tritici CRL 75-36-700-3]EFP92329.1 hypothetical protein PGTG_18003 [Puccinia graminis f. sp. tritici CRL 75-36-700-3]